MPRLLPFILGAIFLVTACGSSSDEEGGRPFPGSGGASTPSVEAVQARLGALPLEERLSGTVRARNQVVISPEVNGPIVAVEAETGDYVQEGEALVRLRSETFEQQVRQAEATLKTARADARSAEAKLQELQSQLRRTEQLAEQQFESQQQLESLRAQVDQAEAAFQRAQAQVDQAKATLDERRTDLRRTVVRAPVSGYVGERNAQVGQRVDNTTELYTMGVLDNVKVQVELTDRLFGRIREGQTARVRVPDKDTTLMATVTRISPFISNESYSAEAEIEIPNEDRILSPGMFVEVDVTYGETEQATIVPLSAVYENPTTGERGVFLAPTLGTEVPVEIPDEYDQDDPPPLTQPTPTEFREVEILAEGPMTAGVRGLDDGDWVITNGQNLLSQAGTGRVDARVRPLPWSRIVSLQQLQDEDLLRRILERQQEVAQQRFANGSNADDSTVLSDSAQESTTDS